MYLFMDDIRPTPQGFARTYSVNETIVQIVNNPIVELSLDHDLGVFTEDGGDGSEVTKFLACYYAHGLNVMPDRVVIHSANTVGVTNMASDLGHSNAYGVYHPLPYPKFTDRVAERTSAGLPRLTYDQGAESITVDLSPVSDSCKEALRAYHERAGHMVLPG